MVKKIPLLMTNEKENTISVMVSNYVAFENLEFYFISGQFTSTYLVCERNESCSKIFTIWTIGSNIPLGFFIHNCEMLLSMTI